MFCILARFDKIYSAVTLVITSTREGGDIEYEKLGVRYVPVIRVPTRYKIRHFHETSVMLMI